MTRIPPLPKNPERICWGCDKYCPADDLACGNGTIRALHPVELFGEDWYEWVENKRERGEEARRGTAARSMLAQSRGEQP